ncbi:MAG: hypothetical protein O7F09_04135 [Chloroflexi bacterium]|nr:hypothetical protein [Chloroflexota bacterium]MCZ6789475.1 hypothetical protein [Chloroflexota bacterium]MCZ6891684.1 hypothetical protein [Chloroflexota bacterium]
MANGSISVEFPSDLSKEDVQRLAHGLGLTIPEEDLEDVTARFTALMSELNKLSDIDLSGVDPSPIFPFEGGRQQ